MTCKRKWTSIDLRRMKLVGDMLANTLQNVSCVSIYQAQCQSNKVT
ncbi:hypothetical protein [Rheinheimera gaetbuli]